MIGTHRFISSDEMTTFELFAYILLAVLAQVGLFAAIAFFRHWRAYGQLKHQLADLGGDAERPEPSETPPAPSTDGESWSGYRDFRVMRKVFEDANRSVCSFYMAPVDGGTLPTFQPGQFLTFRIDVAEPGTNTPAPIIRCYSLSMRPGLDQYRISVKRVSAPADAPDAPPGLSSNYLHDHVQEGEVLAARAPGGHFFLHSGKAPVVLIAGGIGITPIFSMLDTMLAQNSTREIYVFYGVRNGADHAFKEHLQDQARAHPNVHLHVCYSRPRPEDVLGTDYQHNGHVDIKLLRMTLPLALHQFYVCGPRGMMEALVPALRDWGVAEHNIHFEAFGPASLPAAPAQRQSPPSTEATAPEITVSFARSGKTLAWTDAQHSLLEFAEANAIRIDSGCRAGACGACETAIEDGEVVYDTPPEYEPKTGHCLLCVSRPKRNLTLQA